MSSAARIPAAALAALALAACGPEGADAPAARPHVVLVLIDTLRIDHTSLAGYARDTTPGLAAIAAEGLVFESHFANAPWTKPSVASILTGLLPPAHGAQWGDVSRAAAGEVDVLAPGFETLPELLRRAGYATRAFMTNRGVTPGLGYGQGFDRFESLPPSLEGDSLAVEKTRLALDEAVGPTFVWCHLMAPHEYAVPREAVPFQSKPATPIGERFGHAVLARRGIRFREQAIDVYDAAVRYDDGLVRALFDHLRARHPDTLLIVTSDHGEEFADHGGYLHARTLYNELLHVPLVLWGPRIPAGERVSRLTSSVDLLPTVLDYLGLPATATQGASLLAAEGAEGTVYAEKRSGQGARRALLTRGGKFVETKPRRGGGGKPAMAGEGRWEFFPDPVGRDDADALARIDPERLADARRRIERTWSESRALYREKTAGQEVRRRLTDEEAQALRELGYAEMP